MRVGRPRASRRGTRSVPFRAESAEPAVTSTGALTIPPADSEHPIDLWAIFAGDLTAEARQELAASLRQLQAAGRRVALVATFGTEPRAEERALADLVAAGAAPPAPYGLFAALKLAGLGDVRRLGVLGASPAILEAGRRAGAGLVVGLASEPEARRRLLGTEPDLLVAPSEFGALDLRPGSRGRPAPSIGVNPKAGSITDQVVVNGRSYRLPHRPTVVFTIDGCAPEYLDDALARGLMPRLAALLSVGAFHRGLGFMPTLTNPNNVSIVTGVSPAVHGIPGNHHRDPSGAEVQLTDPSHLRAETIHAALQRAGVPVLAVTAKDKLRRLLAEGQVPSISAERAAELGLPALGLADVPALVGRAAPKIYDWDASHYAMEIGLAVHRHLVRTRGAGLGLLYVSLTDYVQHKQGPGGELADRFFRRFDELLGEYLDAGFLVGITADHGMNAKQQPDGSPRVHYLEDVLAAAGLRDYQVVLPITDPYVLHHGALGSFAWVYLPPADRERARAAIAALDGVEEVFSRQEAAAVYEHPADRIGDLSVASDARTALGKSAAKHDLSAVATGLRSHGGRHEQIVPIVVSEPLQPVYAARHAAGVRNADLHDLLLNGPA